MKYGIDGKKNKDIIETYKEDSNRIEIKYLDGSTKTIPLTKEDLESIRNLSIQQAEERRDSNRENFLQKNVEILGFVQGGIFVSLMHIIFGFLSSDKGIDDVAFSAFISSFNAIILVINGHVLRISKEELKDIRKYNIYLNHRDIFEKYKETLETYQNVEYNGPIDINTIDDYSFEDLEQMRDNIKSMDSYDRFCDIASSSVLKLN